jgi:hypothetical protein
LDKECVILDIPEKLARAIDRAVDRDFLATNRRTFIIKAIHEKLKEIDGSLPRADGISSKKLAPCFPPEPASEPDDGYILPEDPYMQLLKEKSNEERKKSKFCKDIIRYMRYENRPVTLQEITKQFQFYFSDKLIEDQLIDLEKEGILFKKDQDVYRLSR